MSLSKKLFFVQLLILPIFIFVLLISTSTIVSAADYPCGAWDQIQIGSPQGGCGEFQPGQQCYSRYLYTDENGQAWCDNNNCESCSVSPTTPPSCVPDCVFSQRDADGIHCYSGTCTSTDCGFNRNCVWKSDCDSTNRVTCPGGPTPTPVSGPCSVTGWTFTPSNPAPNTLIKATVKGVSDPGGWQNIVYKKETDSSWVTPNVSVSGTTFSFDVNSGNAGNHTVTLGVNGGLRTCTPPSGPFTTGGSGGTCTVEWNLSTENPTLGSKMTVRIKGVSDPGGWQNIGLKLDNQSISGVKVESGPTFTYENVDAGAAGLHTLSFSTNSGANNCNPTKSFTTGGGTGTATPTLPPNVTPTSPPSGLTAFYRIVEAKSDSEAERLLDSASDIPYGSKYETTEPIKTTFTLKDQTPGIKWLYVRFLDSQGKTIKDLRKSIKLLPPDPQITSASCTFSPTGSGTEVTVKGLNFGDHTDLGQGKVIVGGKEADILSWSSVLDSGGSPTPGLTSAPTQRPTTNPSETPGACIQVISYAKNPDTGVCEEFPTPCDIPQGWESCTPQNPTLPPNASPSPTQAKFVLYWGSVPIAQRIPLEQKYNLTWLNHAGLPEKMSIDTARAQKLIGESYWPGYSVYEGAYPSIVENTDLSPYSQPSELIGHPERFVLYWGSVPVSQRIPLETQNGIIWLNHAGLNPGVGIDTARAQKLIGESYWPGYSVYQGDPNVVNNTDLRMYSEPPELRTVTAMSDQTAILGAYVSRSTIVAKLAERFEGKASVEVTTDDGKKAMGVCRVNTTGVELSARPQCRTSGDLSDKAVSIKIYEATATTKKPLYDLKVDIDKEGSPLSFNPKLELGKNYVLIYKAPRSLAKMVEFTAEEGTTNIPPITPFIGDIYGAGGLVDGVINSVDTSEVIREWNLTQDNSKTADFNKDMRVNSIDYSCLIQNFNKTEDKFEGSK